MWLGKHDHQTKCNTSHSYPNMVATDVQPAHARICNKCRGHVIQDVSANYQHQSLLPCCTVLNIVIHSAKGLASLNVISC